MNGALLEGSIRGADRLLADEKVVRAPVLVLGRLDSAGAVAGEAVDCPVANSLACGLGGQGGQEAEAYEVPHCSLVISFFFFSQDVPKER